MTQTFIQTDLSVLCPELLKYLPGEWRCRHVNINGGEINRMEDSLHLNLSIDGRKLVVSYIRPADLDGNKPSIYEKLTPDALTTDPLEDPSMKFSLLRSMEDIAIDIHRQLLPRIISVHAKVLARIAEANKTITRMRELRTEFAQMIGESRVPQSNYSLSHMVDGAIVKLQINCPSSITVNLQGVPEEKVRAILKILKNQAA